MEEREGEKKELWEKERKREMMNRTHGETEVLRTLPIKAKRLQDEMITERILL